jgi:hypothetical protein
MRRRLDRDGEKVLAGWLDHYKPPDETRRLIAEAISAFSEDENQIRFYAQDDLSNPGVIIIEPRDGLTVHVRVWGADPGQFTVVRIIDEGARTQD